VIPWDRMTSAGCGPNLALPISDAETMRLDREKEATDRGKAISLAMIPLAGKGDDGALSAPLVATPNRQGPERGLRSTLALRTDYNGSLAAWARQAPGVLLRPATRRFGGGQRGLRSILVARVAQQRKIAIHSSGIGRMSVQADQHRMSG
jgi:hypothetical protein